MQTACPPLNTMLLQPTCMPKPCRFPRAMIPKQSCSRLRSCQLLHLDFDHKSLLMHTTQRPWPQYLSCTTSTRTTREYEKVRSISCEACFSIRIDREIVIETWYLLTLTTILCRSILQQYPPILPFNDIQAPWLTGRPTSDPTHPFTNSDITNTYHNQPTTFTTNQIVTPLVTLPPSVHHFQPTYHFTPIQTHHLAIGTIYSTSDADTFVFKCFHEACHPKSFGRWYDFKRHYNGAHAVEVPQFWCAVDGCERSDRPGGRSFPRKDKLREHVRKVHVGFALA